MKINSKNLIQKLLSVRIICYTVIHQGHVSLSSRWSKTEGHLKSYNCPRKYNCIRKALRIRNPRIDANYNNRRVIFPNSKVGIALLTSLASAIIASYMNCISYTYILVLKKNMECTIDGIVHVNNENGESDIDVYNQEPIMGSWYNRSNFTLCISEHPNWNYTFESMEYPHYKFLVGIFYCKPWSLRGTLIFSGN